MPVLIDWAYIVAAILFILGLKLLGKQATARKGNLISAVGMLIAIVATLLVGQGNEDLPAQSERRDSQALRPDP